MKIEAGKFYRTRSGEKAYVGYQKDDSYFIGHFNSGCISSWYANGSQCGEPSRNDLIAEWYEPRMGEFWMNVYMTADGPQSGGRFTTKAEADDVGRNDTTRLACVRIKWTEGEGL